MRIATNTAALDRLTKADEVAAALEAWRKEVRGTRVAGGNLAVNKRQLWVAIAAVMVAAGALALNALAYAGLI